MRRLLSLLAAVVLTAGFIAVTAQPAPAATGPIHPGVQTTTYDTTTPEATDGGQCTANFIYQDGSNVYIGQAAHCAGLGAATDTNGCTAESLPIGTPVEIEGASELGTLAYSSWISMQAKNLDPDSEECQYNDFALVKLDPADVSKVDPTVPHWGGPAGIRSTSPAAGEKVYTYGNSSLRGGITELSPKTGYVVETSPGGWSITVYTASPGIPGDSGSAFLDKDGKALGVLSTVAIAPLTGSNGVGSIAKELAYAKANGFGGLTLVNGTSPFSVGIAAALRSLG